MAEEEFGEIEDVAPKRSKIVIILVAILLLAALGGGGYYAYNTFFKKQEAQEPAAGAPEGKKTEPGEQALKKEEAPPKPGLGIMVPMEPLIVNLAQTDGKRFLKISITLELSSPEVNAEINENIQKIKDSILILLSSKTFEDVYSVQGKFKLKDEITTRVNRFLVLGHVKDAYFTEFVIQ